MAAYPDPPPVIGHVHLNYLVQVDFTALFFSGVCTAEDVRPRWSAAGQRLEAA